MISKCYQLRYFHREPLKAPLKAPWRMRSAQDVEAWRKHGDELQSNIEQA